MLSNDTAQTSITGQDYAAFVEQAQQALAPDLWRRLATQRRGDTPNAVERRLIGVGYRALYGWAIAPAAFPIWRVDGSVGCSCWQGKNCVAVGKHPLIAHSSAAVPTAPVVDQLAEMLLEPSAFATYNVYGRTTNLALLTGQRSGGLLVADVDPRHGGSLASVWDAGWPQDTPIERTGGSGWHVYVRWPFDGAVPNLPTYLTGVELKGDGSLVIVSPSRHANGQHYHWLAGHAPWQREVALLPDSVAQCILAQAPAGGQAGDDVQPLTPDAFNEWRDVGLSPRQVTARAEARYQRALERVARGEHRKNVLYLLAAQLYGLGLPTALVAEWCEAFVAEVYGP